MADESVIPKRAAIQPFKVITLEFQPSGTSFMIYDPSGDATVPGPWELISSTTAIFLPGANSSNPSGVISLPTPLDSTLVFSILTKAPKNTRRIKVIKIPATTRSAAPLASNIQAPISPSITNSKSPRSWYLPVISLKLIFVRVRALAEYLSFHCGASGRQCEE